MILISQLLCRMDTMSGAYRRKINGWGTVSKKETSTLSLGGSLVCNSSHEYETKAWLYNQSIFLEECATERLQADAWKKIDPPISDP